MSPSEQILNFFFPRRARDSLQLSKKFLDFTESLAPHPELCVVCKKHSTNFHTHASCRREFPLHSVHIAFRYRLALQKLITDIKFRHRAEIADFFWQKMARSLATNPLRHESSRETPRTISFVPSHRFRHHRIKGYNQSQLLAHATAHHLGLPVTPLLTKTRLHRKLTGLSRSARLRKISQTFSPLAQNLEKIPKNSGILRIDDVTTTGATLGEIARTTQKIRPDLTQRALILARRADDQFSPPKIWPTHHNH